MKKFYFLFILLLCGASLAFGRNWLLIPISCVRSSAPPIAGYVRWWDATDTCSITQAGSLVSVWADKSGGGFNATQSTGANQPGYGTGGLNGKSYMSFNGSTQFFDLSTANIITSGSGFSMFIATTISVTTEAPILAGNSDQGYWKTGFFIGNLNYGNWLFGGSGWSGTNATRSIGGAFITTGSYLVEFFYDGTGYNTQAKFNLYASGASQILTDAATAVTAPTAAMIGKSNSNNAMYNGNIYEILIYPSQLSSGDRGSVETYFNTKFGL